jgi:P4 family phage/plasmid primase-like protien
MLLLYSINIRMEIPKIEFKTLKEIKKFLELNKTDLANYYVTLMKSTMRIIGKEQELYYYDPHAKLWLCQTKEVYDGFIADFLNQTGKDLIKAVKKIDFDEDDEEEVKIKKLIRQKQNDFDSETYISAIIKRSTGKLQDNKFVTKLNSNPDYLPIKNGKKVNLQTGEITDRDQNDYFSYECEVEVTKTTEKADEFFKQVMPNKNTMEYLRKVLGYLLTGNMDGRVFFLWYGDGSNGKSVIMKLLKCILGPLYHQCSKGIFMKGSQEKVEGASPDKIALIGIRCATYSEGETADAIEINESFLKMVSGKDEINARALFRAPLTFFPVCKMNLLTNYKPNFNGDKANIQRIRYIFLDSSFVDTPDPKKQNEFKKDDDFVDSLCTKYLSQVFTWILKGSIEYYKTKDIIAPKEFQERTTQIFNEHDSITSFLKNKIVISGNDKDYIKRKDVVDIYQKYCNDNTQRCQPRSTLFKRFDDLKIRVATLHGYDIYRGIKIINHEIQEINDEDYDHGIEKIDYSVKVTKEEQIKALEKTTTQLKEEVKKEKTKVIKKNNDSDSEDEIVSAKNISINVKAMFENDFTKKGKFSKSDFDA